MAVPFYLPEGGGDDSISPTSTSSSSGASGATSSQMSTSTTTSATQTPAQSPLVPDEQLVMAVCEALYRCSINTASTPIFQYPPPSPSCSVLHSPIYTGGDVFFPGARSTPRTPRTSISFAGDDEVNILRGPMTCPVPGVGVHAGIPPAGPYPSGPVSMAAINSSTATTASTNTVNTSQLQHQHHHQQQQHHHPHYHHLSPQYHYAPFCHYPFTPPLTPSTSANANASNTLEQQHQQQHPLESLPTARLPRCYAPDAARRTRLTSTGEDEREHLSDPETSWDEYDHRFNNFAAARENLQEFSGRIPPRKKKKELPKAPKKEKNFTWPTVVTVFFFAMGCGYFVAR